VDPWQVVPTTALTAYRYRHEIQHAWADILRTLRLAGAEVVVTGLPGAGKSVLFDHLSGSGFKESYRLPGPSPHLERKKAHGDRFLVIPGQDSAERLEALDRQVAGNKTLTGLVYVACNGYVTTRRAEAKEVLETELSLERYAALQREREADDLRQVGQFFRRSIREKRRRTWILVVLNKYDLYCLPEDVQAAARSNYEDPNTRFGQALSEITGFIGADNLSVIFWPASGWPEDFKYREHTTLVPSFSLEQRTYSIAMLSQQLRRLTHGNSS